MRRARFAEGHVGALFQPRSVAHLPGRSPGRAKGGVGPPLETTRSVNVYEWPR